MNQHTSSTTATPVGLALNELDTLGTAEGDTLGPGDRLTGLIEIGLIDTGETLTKMLGDGLGGA